METFRTKFRFGKSVKAQSYTDFAFHIKINLYQWIYYEKVDDNFANLVQIICWGKFYGSISAKMRFWLRNVSKNIEEADTLAYIYLAKRGPMNEKTYLNPNKNSNMYNKIKHKKLKQGRYKRKWKFNGSNKTERSR